LVAPAGALVCITTLSRGYCGRGDKSIDKAAMREADMLL
jgi:hypothetical protein